MYCRIFIYTHRRMAITADDVSLEDIVPISLDFAVVEGEHCVFSKLPVSAKMMHEDNDCEASLHISHAVLLLVSSPEEIAVVGELSSFPLLLHCNAT